MQPRNWNAVLEAGSDDVRRLSFVTRYSSIPVSFHETVSEHQYWVALYSILIHNEMFPEDDHLVGPILLKAIIHDLAEAVTGDVVRTFKYSSENLKHAIDQAEEKIIDSFPKRIVNLYRQYDDFLTADGDPSKDNSEYEYCEAVVKAADFMSLQQYMNRERLRGNREIEPFFDRMIVDLHKAGDKVAQSTEPRVRPLADLYYTMASQASASKNYTT